MSKFTDGCLSSIVRYRGRPERCFRIDIFKDTLQQITDPDKLAFLHKKAEENMQKWKGAKFISTPWLSVIEGDWADVTQYWSKKTGKTYAVLNLANQFGPGGGVAHGAAAQEENMWRRTDCALSVKDEDAGGYSKPMQDLVGGQLGFVYFDYSPRVCFKTKEIYHDEPELGAPEFTGYEQMADEDIFHFFEIRSAAIDASTDVSKFKETECRKRIEAQLNTLIKHGIRHVVLGAFGCGAFRNPEKQVATIYKEELEKRRQHFDHVLFAIYPRKGQTLVATFTDVLEPLFNMQPSTPPELDDIAYKAQIESALTTFRNKIGRIDQHRFPKALQEATSLLSELEKTKETYFKDMDALDAKQNFINNCRSLINQSKEGLERDLGWGEYLMNLLKALVNALIQVVSFGQAKPFFTPARSKSLVAVEEVAQKLYGAMI